MKIDINASALRGKERGRRVFVLGNGPSLLTEDLSKLSGELVIGMNASTRLEAEYGFVQKYYCVSDARFLNHPEKRIWATSKLDANTVRVLRRDLNRFDDPIFESKTVYVPHLKRDGFSENLEIGFYYGCSTTMLAIQLAHHLGCQEIFLLGVDLRYSKESPRFYKEKSPQVEDSFTSVQVWNIANAYNVMRSKNVGLYLCSKNSFLRPYIPYRDFGDIRC